MIDFQARPNWMRPALALCLLPLSALPAAAQKSDAEANAEIDFARGLAADWSFVDIAETVIRNVEESGVSSRMSEELGLVKCDVYAIGARSERDVERRNELFDEALGAYESFIEDNPQSSSKTSAEVAFVDTSAAYARFLGMAIEDATGEASEKLSGRRIEVLTAAVDQTSDLVSSMSGIPTDERSEAESRQLFDLMLNRGGMLSQIGAAENAREAGAGQFFVDQAILALEALVFEAGDGTSYALRAYIEMGSAYARMGDYRQAVAFGEATVDLTVPVDPQTWKDLVNADMTDGEKELRFLFLERAIPGLMEAYLQLGKLGPAMEYGLHFVNFQRREGLSLSPYGHQAMLSVAKLLINAGGFVAGDLAAGEARWFATEAEAKDAVSSRRNRRTAVDLALRFAQTTKEENAGNLLRVRAQKLMAEIITRPGVVPSPQILFEAAEGQYLDALGIPDRTLQTAGFASALDGFRGVLSSLDGQGQATRLEFGARVMYGMGNCYRKLDRSLEAAMAYREGATTWLGDPSFDSKNAQAYYQMITNFARGANGDRDPLEALISESERIVAEEGESKRDEVLFNLGKKAERRKELDKATAQYQQVAQGSDFFERAKVQIGVCMVKAKDTASALVVFDDYLDTYVNDPTNASTGQNFLAKRQEAKATAEFYRGFILFNNANASGTTDGFKDVATKLENFYIDYQEQPTLAPWTMQMVIESRLKSDERESAKELLVKLIAAFPESKYTGRASVTYYKTLEGLHEAAQGEAKHPILLEMAQQLELANNVSSSPSFANLRKESQHWLDLAEYAKAEALLRKLVEQFDGEANAESVRRYVKPDLGRALLAQKKVAEAMDILQPLALDTDKSHRPSRTTMVNWCRSVVGWVEGSGKDVAIVPGAGQTAEDFEAVSARLNTIAAGGDKWTSCDWYEDKFMSIYALYVWGQVDSAKLDAAKKQIGTVMSETESDFSIIDQFCSSDETPADVRATLGNKTLQDRYRWLNSKL
ncbi:MAG: tetratricopeptide (TPR) repeat protein [Chlamydiales bacterium]|jgi:tetratricopeptide (TPR) repeat protein